MNEYALEQRRLVKAMKKRLPWHSGLEFWTKTNDQGWVIASRHWPHIIEWSWALYYYPPKTYGKWNLKPYWHPWASPNKSGSIGLGLSILGRFRFSYQREWMLRPEYKVPQDEQIH